MIVGVLALQGGVEEHIAALEACGIEPRKVRLPKDLKDLDGIIIPGGESTVIDKLARNFGIADPLSQQIHAGLPVFATCAGLIYMAKHLENPAKDQRTLEMMDIVVRRNAFGAQCESFDTSVDISWGGESFPQVQASFIRAPIVTAFGVEIEPIAVLGNGDVVGVKQGRNIALSFHPEETGDFRIHKAWLEMIVKGAEQVI